MTLAVSLLLLFAPGALAADPQPDCSAENRGSLAQQDANLCAALDYQAADKALNEAYARLAAARRGRSKALLKQTELAWITYRDSECAFQMDTFGEGSMAPMVESYCLTRLTVERTTLLVEALDP